MPVMSIAPLALDASAISIAYTDSASLSAANRTLPGPKVMAPSDLAAIGPLTIPSGAGLTQATAAATRARVETLVKIARLRFIQGSVLVCGIKNPLELRHPRTRRQTCPARPFPVDL